MIQTDLRNNPIRRVNKMKAQHKEELRLLKLEIADEKEKEISSADNFLRSSNINAPDEEIDIHLDFIRQTYDKALEM